MADEHKGTPAEVWLRHGQSTAAFTPSEGCWCTAFRIARDGKWFSILAEPPSWEALRTRPTMYGNPLLFPYPYGVRDGTFEYRGQVYHLPPGRELGRAVHGVVRDHAWTVERMWEDGDGAHLEALFRHEGELLAEYPFPFLMAATHTLAGGTLTDHWRVTNLGDGPMPMGLGIHPYFGLPLFAGGRVSDLRMQSDVGNLRPFDLARMQGGKGEWPCVPAEGALDMRPGQRVDEYLNAAAPAERSVLVLYSQHGAEAVAPGEGWRAWRQLAPGGIGAGARDRRGDERGL